MSPRCPICSAPLTARVSSWSFYCPKCDYWAADLKPDIESRSDEIFGQEEEETISFLDAVRIQNFNILLDRVREVRGDRPLDILDVGCATGLFIRVAKSRGHRVLGIEPNPRMAAGAKAQGLDVVQGYFPDAVPASQTFDLITFNDVFEHIPDLPPILQGVKTKLKPDGVLVLNVPSSRGLLFRMGKLGYRLGVTNLWHRLWQTMFYTPHLHYFNVGSLDALATQFGMRPCAPPVELSTVALSGLWARVSADKSASLPKRLATYSAALGLYPLLSVFPKDTFAAFYRLRS
jgi:SAM-dependent methyltransferase